MIFWPLTTASTVSGGGCGASGAAATGPAGTGGAGGICASAGAANASTKARAMGLVSERLANVMETPWISAVSVFADLPAPVQGNSGFSVPATGTRRASPRIAEPRVATNAPD